MNYKSIRLTVAAALLLGLSGCSSLATKNQFYLPITAELRAGRYDTVVARMEEAREKKRWGNKDRFLYFIDAGLANYYAERHDSSFAMFSHAEAAAEELFTKSISRAALSLVLNDNVLAYSGEDHEILYANLFNALNFIALDNFDDAFVEIRRANQKLDLLEQKYVDAAEQFQREKPDDTDYVAVPYEANKVRFNSDAFARWLSMHMYAADGKMDDARLDFDLLQHAFTSQPHIYPFSPPDVQYYSPERAILSVVGLAGLAPVKEAETFRIRTDKELHLVQVLYTNTDGDEVAYTQFPADVKEDYYFKFAMPDLVPRASDIVGIRLYADSQLVGELELLEDLSLVAIETFEAKKALIFFRTVARAIVKGLVTHRAKEKADKEEGGWLKKIAIDIGSDLTENADLRCSQFLPGRIFVADFEIEPGVYDFTIEFVDIDGNLVHRRFIDDYKVLGAGLNMIQAHSAR